MESVSDVRPVPNILRLTLEEKDRFATVITDPNPALKQERIDIFRRIVAHCNAEVTSTHQNELLNKVTDVIKDNGNLVCFIG
jgi:hypothetical protein